MTSFATDWPVVFARALSHGMCVGVELPAALDSAPPLEGEELAIALTLSGRARAAFTGGRIAARAAAARLGFDLGSITRTPRGAPRAPDGWTVSISHKDTIGVALVAPRERGDVGVDVEVFRQGRLDISRRVLTSRELADLAGLDGEARQRAVLLRFSIKEAIYKAIDPCVQRYVSFQEVDVWPHADGTVSVQVHGAVGEGLLLGATWQVDGDLILATAAARAG